jgi:hypothetical protein
MSYVTLAHLSMAATAANTALSVILAGRLRFTGLPG